MPAAGELHDLMATAVCEVRVGQASSGTGWLAASGTVITAGHLLSGPEKNPLVELRFPDHPMAITAQVATSMYVPEHGIDFAVLSADTPPGRPGLPISLERIPQGSLVSMGYGVTLRSISAASGELIGLYDPQNSSANRLFRCRSTELAEEGYSGAPIVSLESASVVAIQVEAVIGGRGARDTVLAMPLYRIAERWSQLEEIEAGQAERSDGYAARSIIVVDVAADQNFAREVSARLAAAGLQVTVSQLSRRQPGTKAAAELSDARAMVLMSAGSPAALDRTRELVVGATLRKVPIVVAAPPDAELPDYLSGFARIQASADAGATAEGLDAALRTLDDEPTWVASLTALSDALEEIQSQAPDPVRFQPHIDELRSMIGGWGSRLRRQDRRVRAGFGLSAPDQAPAEPVPSVGVRPFDPEHLFRDRVREAETVSRFLADGSSGIVTVVGRAGIGKTALTAHVMAALRQQRWLFPGTGPRIDGMAFLSTRTSSGITSAEVVLKLARLVNDATLVRSWSSAATPLDRRIAQLVEAIGERRIVILLDNFEDVLDTSGVITGGDELGALLAGLAEVESGLKFLITSRERIAFAARSVSRCRVVELAAGLPLDEAAQMLRELDPQAEFGLRDASDDDLASIAARVHGIPRALQLVVGMLANDPLLALADLTDLHAYLIDESLSKMIAETHTRLDDPARWVLLALAVLGRPVPLGALDYILRPFAPGSDVPSVARNLIRTQVVSVDRLSRRLALHPADRHYLLTQAAHQRPATLALMHRRTAEYYVS
ncbi:MAG: trypsin-like peptidase domain-containing protein, partial [Streptosporangiaceae bacterium]